MTTQEKDVVLYERKDKIAIITMNRPHRMNALSRSMSEGLHHAWKRFKEEEDAWVAILTGSGDRAFCAGADLKELAETSPDQSGQAPKKRPWERSKWMPTPRWMEIYKPTIAAVNGFALAGGWWMAQDCDLVVAAEHAEFGIPETRWNLPAPWAAPLTSQIGMRHALEVTLLPWRISARRAAEMGFVNWVVPKEKLMDKAMEVAEGILENAPAAVRSFLEMYYQCYGLPQKQAVDMAFHMQKHLSTMQDTIEGPRAFAEKRKPNFKNL